MLPYGRQTIEDDDIQAVVKTLKGDYLTTGPAIAQFENKLCEITGAKYAIACSNGTTALHMALIAADIGPDDYAIVPTITFLATANAVRYCGAHVIFCDVDPQTGLMTAETFQNALNQAKGKPVKAVLPVHLGGQPADLQAIHAIADQHAITVIADSCHAIGGTYHNHAIGSCHYEDMATFSFHPVKTIAMGEGGAITTNDPEKAQRMKTLRHHGMSRTDDMPPWVYEMQDLGYNYRVTDMQCALGLSQLNKLERFIDKREALATHYDQRLANAPPFIQPPSRVQNEQIGWHLYAIKIDFDAASLSRADLMNALKDNNIGSQVHYIPVHTQPYYKKLYGDQNLPGAQQYYNRTLSLPLYPQMETSDVDYVVDTLISLCTKG